MDPNPDYIFDADPDPAYHFNADPDFTFQFDTDPCGYGSATLRGGGGGAAYPLDGLMDTVPVQLLLAGGQEIIFLSVFFS